jgi:hypothetical protein
LILSVKNNIIKRKWEPPVAAMRNFYTKNSPPNRKWYVNFYVSNCFRDTRRKTRKPLEEVLRKQILIPRDIHL